MAVIKSQVDTNSKDFAANDVHLRGLVADLQKQLDQVEKGGGQQARKKHTKRGKMLPRERIKQLIDPGTPFLESGLSEEFVLGDLTVIGSLTGGGDLGEVDLIYVPEPASALLLAVAFLIGLFRIRQVHERGIEASRTFRF